MKYVHVQLSQAQDLADYLESKLAMDAPVSFDADSLFTLKLNKCIQAIIQINLYYADEDIVIDTMDIYDVYDETLSFLGVEFASALFEKYMYIISNGYEPTYNNPVIVGSYGNLLIEVN